MKESDTTRRGAVRFSRAAALIRVGIGAACLAAPRVGGGLLTGDDAKQTGALPFVAAFAVRDALLGISALRSRTVEELCQATTYAAVADGVDAAVVMTHFVALPFRRRWVALAATAGPAVLDTVLAAALRRRSAQGGLGDQR